MTCWALIDDDTGELVAAPLKEPLPAPGFLNVELPDDWPDTTRWDAAARAFAPIPVRLDWQGILALYTPPEVARIFAAPVIQITQLLIAIRYFGVVLGSTEHVQGTALIAGLGLLDGQREQISPTEWAIVNDGAARVARIVAGLPPL